MLLHNQKNGQGEGIGSGSLKMIQDRDSSIILKGEDLRQGMREIWKIGKGNEFNCLYF